jgi:AcrR family transcriptional regulator
MPKIFSNDQKEKLCQSLKQNGIILLREHGCKGLNIRDLTKITGISTGTFYHFFPSKEDLILAIMKDSQDHLTRRFQELYQLHGSVGKSDFISLYYEFFIEDKTNVFQYLSRDDLTALLLRSDHSISLDSVQISMTENLKFLAHPKKNINLNAVINFTQLINLSIENKDLLVQEELANTIKKLLENLADAIFEKEQI